jgi:hypothetical protein
VLWSPIVKRANCAAPLVPSIGVVLRKLASEVKLETGT